MSTADAERALATAARSRRGPWRPAGRPSEALDAGRARPCSTRGRAPARHATGRRPIGCAMSSPSAGIAVEDTRDGQRWRRLAEVGPWLTDRPTTGAGVMRSRPRRTAATVAGRAAARSGRGPAPRGSGPVARRGGWRSAVGATDRDRRDRPPDRPWRERPAPATVPIADGKAVLLGRREPRRPGYGPRPCGRGRALAVARPGGPPDRVLAAAGPREGRGGWTDRPADGRSAARDARAAARPRPWTDRALDRPTARPATAAPEPAARMIAPDRRGGAASEAARTAGRYGRPGGPADRRPGPRPGRPAVPGNAAGAGGPRHPTRSSSPAVARSRRPSSPVDPRIRLLVVPQRRAGAREAGPPCHEPAHPDRRGRGRFARRRSPGSTVTRGSHSSSNRAGSPGSTTSSPAPPSAASRRSSSSSTRSRTHTTSARSCAAPRRPASMASCSRPTARRR